MSSRTAAIIPAFNEEMTIGSVVLEARRFVDEVIVVDDGSTDRTPEIAKLAGASVLRLERNHGKGYALKMGLENVKENSFQVVALLDADWQHDPGELPKVIGPVLNGEADLVIGSRFLKSNGSVPRYRKLGLKVLDVTTRLGVKQKISDSQSGFRALSLSAVKNLDISLSGGYSVESEMILSLSEKGMRIKEVPIGVNYEVPHKHKKNPVAHGLEVFARVLRIVSQKRPLLMIGVPGFFIFLIGLVLGILSLVEITLFGWGWLFQTILAAFLFIIGMVLEITSLTLNSIAELINETKR